MVSSNLLSTRKVTIIKTELKNRTKKQWKMKRNEITKTMEKNIQVVVKE
jgi:hypothetical protein